MSIFRPSLIGALLLAVLPACSGSSSGDSATVTLAVTDAATDELSTFTIGLEAVELVSATNPPVSLLQEPVAVDFAALTDLSRILNVMTVPPDVYTGVEVTLLYDSDRVHLHGNNVPASLMDAEGGGALTGTQVLPIDFLVPLEVTAGNYVLELDLDLDQSVDVDEAMNTVFFEPAILPRVNRTDPREHAVTGDLRAVQLENSRFRVALSGTLGSEPLVDVSVAPGTVFQIDGQCLLGAAGLALLDTLPVNSWVQAFGTMGSSSSRFQALTVEAGTGTYNGGTDIVEGVIVARTGGAGADATLTVRGHSNDAAHVNLEFNLTFTVLTSFADTKVVRRGSATQYDTDDLNVGQRIRAFGVLDTNINQLDARLPTHVVRMEPTWVFGQAAAAPASGVLTMNLLRVDLRDPADFTWADSGVNPPNPAAFTIEEHNLGIGQQIGAGTPVVALGFFAPVDASGSDFDASNLANRELLPSVLLVRDRLNGFTVTTTATDTAIDLVFSNDPAAPLERAVIDMGFAGETDLVPTGVSLVPKPGTLGLGFYLLHDRTLQTVGLYFTFASFAQALDAALDGGATLFNAGAVGVYDAGGSELPTSLAGVTVH